MNKLKMIILFASCVILIVACGKKNNKIENSKEIIENNNLVEEGNLSDDGNIQEVNDKDINEKNEMCVSQYINNEEAIKIAQSSFETSDGIENFDNPDIKMETITKENAKLLNNEGLEGKEAYVVVFSLSNKTLEEEIIYVDAFTGELYGGLPID